MEKLRGEYRLTDDKSRADIGFIASRLDTTYWAKGRGGDAVRKTLDTSHWLLLFHKDRPAGFCRLVSDYVTFAWLADMFVDEPHRGKGLARWMVETMLALPAADVDKVVLATSDAHGLYEKSGFTPPGNDDQVREPRAAALTGC